MKFRKAGKPDPAENCQNCQVEQQERRKHDANCELRGPGGAVDRRCSCGFRALRVEIATLRAERDAALEDITRLRSIIKQEAARQASAAELACTHSDPDAPERARTHDFCAAVLELLLDGD